MKFRKLSILMLALPLVLGGCLSFSSSPPRETVVLPPGSTLVCANGLQPPC